MSRDLHGCVYCGPINDYRARLYSCRTFSTNTLCYWDYAVDCLVTGTKDRLCLRRRLRSLKADAPAAPGA